MRKKSRKASMKEAFPLSWILGILSISTLLFLMGCSSSTDTIFTVGIASWGSQETYQQNIAGFKEGLAKEGFIEGKNIHYLLLNGDLNLERQISNAQSFLQSNVDLVYSISTQGTLVLKTNLDAIPIVFSSIYPVEAGLVKSYETSGNNLVGVCSQVSASRQYEYFSQILPGMKTLGFIRFLGTPGTEQQYTDFSLYFEQKGVRVLKIEVLDSQDIAEELPKIIQEVDAVYTSCDPYFDAPIKASLGVVNEIARKAKKPVLGCMKEGPRSGSLLSVQADQQTIGRKAGALAAAILQGAYPSSLATERVEDDFLALNLQTARELGIAVPDSLRWQADEVIS